MRSYHETLCWFLVAVFGNSSFFRDTGIFVGLMHARCSFCGNTDRGQLYMSRLAFLDVECGEAVLLDNFHGIPVRSNVITLQD
jgi:hypothetical protein